VLIKLKAFSLLKEIFQILLEEKGEDIGNREREKEFEVWFYLKAAERSLLDPVFPDRKIERTVFYLLCAELAMKNEAIGEKERNEIKKELTRIKELVKKEEEKEREKRIGKAPQCLFT
jgi:hypothetical protein